MGRIPNRQAVFFELEGVLLHPHDPKDTTPRFFDQAIDALQRFDPNRVDLVIATNQPGIALGQVREREFKVLRDNVLRELEQNHVRLARFYFCPFHPKGRGKWRKESVFRKPNVGMFKMAQQELDLNLSRCWSIGHTSIDVLAGQRAGVGTVLVRTGEAGADGEFDIEPHFVEEDIHTAALRILKFEQALLV